MLLKLLPFISPAISDLIYFSVSHLQINNVQLFQEPHDTDIIFAANTTTKSQSPFADLKSLDQVDCDPSFPVHAPDIAIIPTIFVEHRWTII